ncbi:uncharacterized protein N7515_000978 [Penicillium bovifimosum]|uniref:Hydrophobin n=1 Tax=Penicillium bovifimosum TaxID=126998 RepID=A0A9W9HFZ5_9EURO|nr:uncharacterized protein N7515_000978 [Penicillium bovifimosum]KAJ5146414.1 hypothetical protein N7515_000978 [Penicillium bovifimosum]
MQIKTLLAGLASILAVTAVPMASQKASPTPSASKSLIPHSSSASVSPSPTPTPNPYEAYTCPTGKFKSCCMSVQQTGEDVIKPLGKLVPIVSGLELSSAISFQCKKMNEQDPPDTCNAHGYSPMCCSDQGGALNSCKPFEQVKKNYYTHQMNLPETQADMIMDILT